jgi:hypothetical protein
LLKERLIDGSSPGPYPLTAADLSGYGGGLDNMRVALDPGWNLLSFGA